MITSRKIVAQMHRGNSGKRKIGLKDVCSKFLPLRKEDVYLLQRTIMYVKPYKIRFGLGFLCVVSSIAFGLVQPYCFGKIIASVIAKDSALFLQMIVIGSAAYVLQQIIGFLQSYLFNALNADLIYDVRRDMYEKILEMPVMAFDKMRIGEFFSRLIGDSNTIAGVLTNNFLTSIVDALKVLIIGAAACGISWKMFIVVMISFPISFAIFALFGKKLRDKNQKLVEIRDEFMSNAQETLSGMREIKILGLRRSKLAEFLGLSHASRNQTVHIGIVQTIMETSSQSVNYLSELIVLCLGFYLIVRGELKIELYVAFTSYAAQFGASLMNLTRLNATLQEGLVSIRRIFDVIDRFSYSKEHFGTVQMYPLEDGIRFDNVTFSYDNKTRQKTLHDLSLFIPKRKKVALVGKSGGGKSTIFNLLLRFYEPQTGKISCDNMNIQEFDEASYRKQIAVVQQDPFLFRASILDNLLLANPAASKSEVACACKSAFIHDYINGLPDGYATMLGEKAVNLSSGQKQRLAIARALLKQSPIILFDEATSALDNESQNMIKLAVDALSRNHTVVIIAHRLFTVVDADIIYVMDRGTIVGQGTHCELIKGNGIYQSLYQMELDTLSSQSNKNPIAEMAVSCQ
jgi:ATP-binding cassette, subfamily B, bacterial